MVGKNENLIFHEYLLNMDTSLNIACKPFKFSTYIHKIWIEGSKFSTYIHKMWIEGSMSQNFDLGPSFHFMKCRKLHFLKTYPFFDIKIKTKT